jgi:hypothetical protein
MNNLSVTIAAFSHEGDPGLQALLRALNETGIPHWLEEMEAESESEVWANELPYRVRTLAIDGPSAYKVWMNLLINNNPYTEVSEEDLERLAMEAADDELTVAGQSINQEEAASQTTWSRILEGPDVQHHAREGILCPIDPNLVEWIDEKLHWISGNLFDPLEKPVITLEDYSDWEYMADIEDADFVLSRTLEIMDIPPESNILLYFMQSELAEGQYHADSEQHYIGIEFRMLWRPARLIDVVAHELCHYQLIGQRQDAPEFDELLTDLLVVAYGFGLLKGNESFISEQGGGIQGNMSYFHWQVGRRGYLPREMIAFALALIEYRRSGGLPEWFEDIKPEWRTVFKKSMEYIKCFSGDFQFGRTASE